MDEQRLTRLLDRRPDLADPPPADLAEVLRRAATVASVYLAVDHLDRFTLDVVRAVMALDGRATPPQIAELLGPAAGVDAIAAAAASAEGLLLAAVGPDGTVLCNPSLVHVLGTPDLGPSTADLLAGLTVDELRWVAHSRGVTASPARKDALLSALTAALTDPGEVRRVLDSAPQGAAMLARRLARSPSAQYPTNALYPRGDPARVRPTADPMQWLAWNGLVVKESWFSCVMPREVALALRGGTMVDDVQPVRPALDPVARSRLDVDAEAVAAASELVEQAEALTEALATAPAKLLRSGGVGVRELRRMGKDLASAIGPSGAAGPDAIARRAGLLVELAAAAGLVGQRGACEDGTGELLPARAFEQWCGLEPAARWRELVDGWLAVERFPSLAGTPDADGKPVPALADDGPVSEVIRQRTAVLERLAELPEGAAPSPGDLAEAVWWDAPLAVASGPRDVAGHVGWVVEEASALGLVAGGALSLLGRKVAGGDVAGAASLLAQRLGRESTELVLQADLTAMAPSAAPRGFRERLGEIADVESKGAAVVYRFSEASLRRALDAGRSAAEILEFLAAHATKGVPQPLAYLVEDTARRHGTVRVGAAGSYVRCVDEAVATEIVRSRRLQKVTIRAVAPTVLVSPERPAAVLQVLRAAGYLPAHEGTDGGLVVDRPARRWAERPCWEADRPRAGRSASGASDVARELRAAGWPAGPVADGPAAGRARPGAPAAGAAPARRSASGGRPDVLAPLLVRLAEGSGLGGPDLAAVLRGSGRDTPGALEEAIFGPGGFGYGGGAPCGCQRPSGIARRPEALEELLEDASVHAWTVRVAVRGRRKEEGRSFCAEVEDVGDGAFTLWCHDDDRSMEVALGSLEWARVLTEAEEEALFGESAVR